MHEYLLAFEAVRSSNTTKRSALTDGMKDPDRAAAKRVFDAMMEMRKIDVATIERARKGS